MSNSHCPRCALSLKSFVMSATLLLTVGMMAGCHDAEESYECDTICGEIKTCEDSELDVDDCVDVCYDYVQEDKDLRADAESCAECVDGKSCSDAESECSICENVYEALAE